METREVLAESFRMLRERPKFVLPMLIPTILGMGILSLTIAAQIPISGIPAEEAMIPPSWYLPSMLMLSIVVFIISVLMYGMYPSMVRDRRENRELNLKESLHLSHLRFWSLLGASLLTTIITSAIAVAISFVVVPLIMSGSTRAVVAGNMIEGVVVFLISILFCYAPPAIIMDELKAVESIRRSWEIGKKNYLFTLLIMAVPALISSILSSILMGLPTALNLDYVLILLIPYAIISLFLSAWTIIIPCYAYYDLRS
jgi:membrane-anchored glycerophosphoryl diester phosphodiesterase (GDPDase)